VLPSDLPTAIRHLEDRDLDRLLDAALAERRRRGREPSDTPETAPKRREKAVATCLTPGRLNLVRAAFKAGVAPSQIARHFGISQSDVRKALAGDKSRRAPSRD
jgi:DNA invertase Pin-like site-specific DNA recombinase